MASGDGSGGGPSPQLGKSNLIRPPSSSLLLQLCFYRRMSDSYNGVEEETDPLDLLDCDRFNATNETLN